MSGIKTNLKDLGKSFQKLTDAMKAEDERKRAIINEFKNEFIRRGYSPWMALNLADEKYRNLKQR